MSTPAVQIRLLVLLCRTPPPPQTKTSKKEIKSALEIFQRELRGSSDAGSSAAGGGGGGGGVQHQGTFAPVPPVGVQNMAALYLKVGFCCMFCIVWLEVLVIVVLTVLLTV